MSIYNDLSRRGLIKLNNDFDRENNNSLKQFLNDNRSEYEGIRPHEKMFDKLDDVHDEIAIRGGVVASAVIKRMDKVFDRMMGKIQSEVDRALAIVDEQLDDSAYPSEMDEDDEDGAIIGDPISQEG